MALLSLDSSHHCSHDDVLDGAAAAEIVHRLVQALRDGPNGDAPSCSLHSLVRCIASIQVRKDAHIRPSRDSKGAGLRDFGSGDLFIDRRVELERAFVGGVWIVQPRKPRGLAHLLDHLTSVGVASSV